MIKSASHQHHCQLCATGSKGQPGSHRHEHLPSSEWPGSEVRQLIDQGPTENRIDLTMVGDGYTESEKERFFQDAQRLTDDLFKGQTFASYLPLFNVHAVFVPSKDSGLSDGDTKDTALGLYRSPAGSKRAISVRRPAQTDKAVNLAPDTDYPILIANDDFYGGLGGKYAITTRSQESGSMVLRHELGHNFGDVGEEYDGGQVYRGANHSRSPKVPWAHWAEGPIEPAKAKQLLAKYPWKNLQGGELKFSFEVPASKNGEKPLLDVDLSSVGWQTEKDVTVLLDGKPLELRGEFTEDRSFFRPKKPFAVEPGTHTLTVQEQVKDGNNVLGSVRVTAFESDYDFSKEKIGAFPTFDDSLRMVGYRPTHNSCLMRDMRSTEFCPIDKENMWHKFLKKVSLIDSVETHTTRRGSTKVELKTPRLEGMKISWYKISQRGREREIPELAGKKSWTAEPGEKGTYRAKVAFETAEVRKYDDKFEAVRDVEIA